ncbi:MAG: hypothetical protein DMF58_20185, partial [Acidobacteria bacterium]
RTLSAGNCDVLAASSNRRDAACDRRGQNTSFQFAIGATASPGTNPITLRDGSNAAAAALK